MLSQMNSSKQRITVLNDEEDYICGEGNPDRIVLIISISPATSGGSVSIMLEPDEE